MTRFQLILPVANHNVTKNLTGHRMQVAGTQIYQVNRQINGFQNMYSMNRQTLTVWPGKSILCKKNTSKKSFLEVLGTELAVLAETLSYALEGFEGGGICVACWIRDKDENIER